MLHVASIVLQNKAIEIICIEYKKEQLQKLLQSHAQYVYLTNTIHQIASVLIFH